METGSFGGSIPALYDPRFLRSPLPTINVTRALVPPRVRGPQVARNPSTLATPAGLVEVVGGVFLPSACLFLQKGGNGSRTSGPHSWGSWSRGETDRR